MSWTADEGDERLANRWGTFFIRLAWPMGLGSIPAFLISLLWCAPDRVFLFGGGFAALVVVPAYAWLVARPLRWVWAGADGLGSRTVGARSASPTPPSRTFAGSGTRATSFA